MARFHHWVAAVCLLSVICFWRCESQKGDHNVQELMSRYSSDGSTLTKEEVVNMIQGDYGNYVQEINIDVLRDLMVLADQNGDGRLDISELTVLDRFITKNRS